MQSVGERRPIIIIGGGIGGLTAALVLLRAGRNVRLYEQAQAFGEVGAGLTLSPGVVEAYNRLGLQDNLRAESSLALDVPFLHYRTGKLLAGTLDPGANAFANDKIAARHIHRADLHRILLEAVRKEDSQACVVGHRLLKFHDDADRVRAVFDNGQSVEGRVLIGADGLRSVVRRGAFDEPDPRFAGYVAWRCLVPPEQVRSALSVARAAVYVGHAKVFNRYSLRGGTLLNCVAIAQTDRWLGEGWTTPGTPDELLAEFHDWHPDVTTIMRHAPLDGLIKWALFDRAPLARWVRGRIALLGDAAHPMLPFLGLGGAMAIEDAIMLGRCVLQHGVDEPEAFQHYERVRNGRADFVAEQSRTQGSRIASLDPEQAFVGGAPALDARLYNYDPGIAPI